VSEFTEGKYTGLSTLPEGQVLKFISFLTTKYGQPNEYAQEVPAGDFLDDVDKKELDRLPVQAQHSCPHDNITFMGTGENICQECGKDVYIQPPDPEDDDDDPETLPEIATPSAIQQTPVDFTPDQIQLIKDTVATGATDDEFMLFMYVSRKAGLDPLRKQIYAIKRWDARLKREAMTIQTGIDGYRICASRSKVYCAGRAPTYTYHDNKGIESATAYVMKFVGGKWHEISATAWFSEYVQTKKDGHPTKFWAKMPHGQIAKCAEALAIRKAFPEETGGIYTFEEMAQADSEPLTQLPPSPNTPQTVDTGAPRLADALTDEIAGKFADIQETKDEKRMKGFEQWWMTNKKNYTPALQKDVDDKIEKFWTLINGGK
jgi:phage recombination protein Bet